MVCIGRYNRQGRKAEDRRSRDNHINRGNTRTQTVRTTGTYNQPTAPNAVVLAFPQKIPFSAHT